MSMHAPPAQEKNSHGEKKESKNRDDLLFFLLSLLLLFLPLSVSLQFSLMLPLVDQRVV